MLLSSTAVVAEGTVRTGVGVAEAAARRLPPLLALGARATVGTGADAARSQSAFRDELLLLFDDVTEVAWRQARHARDELGARTSGTDFARAPGARAAAGISSQNGGARRHRVKA
jgi:hypothetical protein